MNVVEVVHCWKSYPQGDGTVHAVRDVSLLVRAGEFVAIRGRSGSGKSTLLNLIGALDTPTGGSVSVRGRDLSQLTENQRAGVRRTDVGSVFQSFNLLPTLRVEENVALPAHLLGRPVHEVGVEVRELLIAVGLEARAGAWPDSLSGGEMQRVALARALINRPAIVLADEPTGNLDSQNAARALDLLADLCRRRGAAVIMVTHSEEAASRADRSIVMKDGEIAEIAG